MKERLKSPVVWGSVLGQAVLMIGLVAPEISDEIKIIGTAVIEILTVFGVLNNPTDRERF